MNLESSIETINIWCPLTSEEIQRVIELAEVGNSADVIAVILEKNKRLFLRDFRTAGTHVFNAYHVGLLNAKEETDRVVLENAKKGNLTAKQIMDKRWEEQRIDDLRQKIFNSGE